MTAVHEHPIQVAPDTIDQLGHANNSAYFGWMQEAAIAHSAIQDWPPERYHEFGAGFVVRSHEIEYYQPALEGQELVVRTSVATMDKVTSLRRYEILRAKDQRLLAKASTLWAFTDYKKGTPRRIPQEISTSFIVVPESEK